MPKIQFDVTKVQKQALEALCEQNDITMEELFRPWVNEKVYVDAKIDPTDDEPDQQVSADKITAKARKAKATREAAALAKAESEPTQPTTQE